MDFFGNEIFWQRIIYRHIITLIEYVQVAQVHRTIFDEGEQCIGVDRNFIIIYRKYKITRYMALKRELTSDHVFYNSLFIFIYCVIL